MVPEKTINAVINHQFSEAFKATNSCNEIELSGFGKFVFNQKKALKRMEKYRTQEEYWNNYINNDSLSPEEKRKYSLKLSTTLNNIEHLSKKIRDYER